MLEKLKKSSLVGEFIKKRRESLGLSQREVGELFTPPVTTQFVSNIERGTTPLPLAHIPVLAKALSVNDSEILTLLEKEYASKLHAKLGKTEEMGEMKMSDNPSLNVSVSDYEFMKRLYDAYQIANPQTRQAFSTVCESILKVRKPETV